MKITPIAGSGQPGTMIGNVEVGSSASPDRKQRAQRAFAGESQVSMNQSDTPTNPLNTLKKRVIKMKTNANPERFGVDEPEVEEPQTLPVVEQQTANPEPIETAQEPEETKPLSPQFAALAKKQRALQVKEREIAQREEALKSQQPQGQAGIDVEKLKENPLGVLQELGLLDSPDFYNQMTERIMSGQSGNQPDIRALREQIKNELKEELGQQFNQRDQQSEQQVLTQLKRDATLLSAKGEDFKLVRATNSQADAVELIHRTFKKTGEYLEVSEALKLIEDELRSEVDRLAKIHGTQQAPVSQNQNEPRPMRTLTTRDGTAAPISRRDRALAAFSGTLKRG